MDEVGVVDGGENGFGQCFAAGVVDEGLGGAVGVFEGFGGDGDVGAGDDADVGELGLEDDAQCAWIAEAELLLGVGVEPADVAGEGGLGEVAVFLVLADHDVGLDFGRLAIGVEVNVVPFALALPLRHLEKPLHHLVLRRQ